MSGATNGREGETEGTCHRPEKRHRTRKRKGGTPTEAKGSLQAPNRTRARKREACIRGIPESHRREPGWKKRTKHTDWGIPSGEWQRGGRKEQGGLHTEITMHPLDDKVTKMQSNERDSQAA